MRHFLSFVLICFVLPVFAQKVPAKYVAGALTGKSLVDQAIKQAGNQGVRVIQGKILPSSRNMVYKTPSFLQQRQDLEHALLTAFPVPEIEHMKLGIPAPAEKQKQVIFEKYVAFSQKMQSFKKEMDKELYYQTHASERRTLAPQEKQYWVKQIVDLHKDMIMLSMSIHKTDPIFQRSKEYLMYALSVIAPELEGSLPKLRPAFIREDRVLDYGEFFLYCPQTPPFAAIRKLFKKEAPLPEAKKGLKIAILNDRSAFLDAVEESHAEGLLFPNHHIKTYDNTVGLLSDIRLGRESFDVILSDIRVPPNGGYYIVNALRRDGYQGVILASTAYDESKSMANSLFSRGFDGMFAIPEPFEKSYAWYDRLNSGLDNYFYYRDLHGWMR